MPPRPPLREGRLAERARKRREKEQARQVARQARERRHVLPPAIWAPAKEPQPPAEQTTLAVRETLARLVKLAPAPKKPAKAFRTQDLRLLMPYAPPELDDDKQDLYRAMRLLSSVWGAWLPDVAKEGYQRDTSTLFEIYLLERLARGDTVNRVVRDIRHDVRLVDQPNHPLLHVDYLTAYHRTLRIAHRLVVSLCAGTIHLPRYLPWALSKDYKIKEQGVQHERQFLVRASYGQEDHGSDGWATGRAGGDSAEQPEQHGQSTARNAHATGVFGWYTLGKYIWARRLHCDRIYDPRDVLKLVGVLVKEGIRSGKKRFGPEEHSVRPESRRAGGSGQAHPDAH